MSDLFDVDAKVKEGDDWRGYTTVEIDGDEYELCYRLPYDDEQSVAISTMGEENFTQIQELAEADEAEDLTDEERERYNVLKQKTKERGAEALTDQEKEELQSLASQDSEAKLAFLMMDPDMVEAMLYVAETCVVPDDEDVDTIMEMSLNEQKEVFDETAKTREQAREMAKARVENIVEKSTDLTAYQIGFTIFMESLGGGEGN